jgi:hypothetical protein
MVPIAIANGALRETTYAKRVGELKGHQISCLTGSLLFGGYIWAVVRLWKPDSSQQALAIGLIWLVMTVGFEFVFGRYARRLPWSQLLHDYNILAGRLWVLVLLWLTVTPLLFYWQLN